MNNTNSSPFGDWMILIGIILLAFFFVYGLGLGLWKIFKFFTKKEKTSVLVMDMTNIIPFSAYKKRLL